MPGCRCRSGRFAGNAHIDGAAAGLLALALLVAVRGRSIWTGIVLAAATLTKFLPAVVLPAFWRPRDWRLPVAFVVTLVVLLPAVFPGRLAGVRFPPRLFLRGGICQRPRHLSAATSRQRRDAACLGIEGLHRAGAGRARFAGRTLRLRDRTAGGIGAARADAGASGGDPWRTVLLVALSPHYPWYLGWLAPLACLAPLPGVLWMLAAAPLLAHGSFEYLAVPGAVYGPGRDSRCRSICRRRLPAPPQALRSAR